MEKTLKEEKPLVISYLRWSSGTQRLGDSERRQMKLASKWLEKNGYEINEDYVLRDDGKSAFYSENFSENGALGKFCNEVKSGKIPRGTILVVEDFSRFSRAKVTHALQRFLELINHGIRIYVAKDDTEYSENHNDSLNIMVSLSKMTAAREESERKSHHLKEFWSGAREKAAQNAKSGEFPVILPSNSPYWLRKVKKQDGVKYFEPITERVEVIKRIFDLADTGGDDGLGLGSTIIVRILESEGVKPFKGEKRNTARSFNDSYVLKLLKDQRLLGFLQPFINPVDETTGKRVRTPLGDPIPNYFPQIISQEQFDRVALKIEQRKLYQSGKVSQKFTNLFTKIVKCRYCGASMTLFTKRGSIAEGGRTNYLQCSEGTRFRKCGNRAVRYFDTFEISIIRSLEELNLSNLFCVNADSDDGRIASKRNEIHAVKKELKVLEKKITNATDLLLSDPNDNDIVVARRILKNQRSILESKLETLDSDLSSLSRRTNYDDFKSNLETVLLSNSGDDEIAIYSKRRAINTHLIDIIQYIAVDGVNKEAWIVFDLEFAKKQIREQFFLGQELLRDATAKGNLSDFMCKEVPTEEEIKAFGTGELITHLKISLKRFTDNPPTRDTVLEMRTAFEYAPSELKDINAICNSAINKNWQSNTRKEYKVLDIQTAENILNDIHEEFYIPPNDNFEHDDEETDETIPLYKNGDIVPRPTR